MQAFPRSPASIMGWTNPRNNWTNQQTYKPIVNAIPWIIINANKSNVGEVNVKNVYKLASFLINFSLFQTIAGRCLCEEGFGLSDQR